MVGCCEGRSGLMDGRMYPDSPRLKHFRQPKREAYAHGRHAEVEVRFDDDTCQTVDEIVTTQVHLEMMDTDACWMDINGVHVWFRAVKKGAPAGDVLRQYGRAVRGDR